MYALGLTQHCLFLDSMSFWSCKQTAECFQPGYIFTEASKYVSEQDWKIAVKKASTCSSTSKMTGIKKMWQESQRPWNNRDGLFPKHDEKSKGKG